MHETIDVLGLGRSLKNYTNTGNFTIGVNNIYDFYKTDVVVVIDIKKRFTKEKLETIERCDPKFFLSQIKEYETHKNFFLLNLHHSASLDLNKDFMIRSSNNSTFVAAFIAAKIFGAKKIRMFGVDFIDHPSLSLEVHKKRAISDFNKLKLELNERGVDLDFSNSLLQPS